MKLYPISPKYRLTPKLRAILLAERKPIRVAGGGRKWLPGALGEFAVVAADHWVMVPISVKRLAVAIIELQKATLPPNAKRSPYRVLLNKKIAGLRQAHPQMFWEIRNWLNSPVAAQLFGVC
jgi:hypothetical protein